MHFWKKKNITFSLILTTEITAPVSASAQIAAGAVIILAHIQALSIPSKQLRRLASAWIQ